MITGKIEEITIQAWKSSDGITFQREKDCLEHERSLMLKQCHDWLQEYGFWKRWLIKPYFHNHTVKTLGHWRDFDTNTGSFLLVAGRMGNGDDRIRMKMTNKYIKLIQYSTDDGHECYRGRIPVSVFNNKSTFLAEMERVLVNHNKKYKKPRVFSDGKR